MNRLFALNNLFFASHYRAICHGLSCRTLSGPHTAFFMNQCPEYPGLHLVDNQP
ncbi:hypothetical Protein YC6258_04845 [Gynuella sunshinyii YC6258]|uniref:Uncharacterized protein n=1 Tax=Gynuella sunshinyii YC6258 TaxID=1445510 RepID=A0A0C5VQK9_9GAMM|nr:hypothetical Protein YC6258_04845 [Gynuella sunshinyii YC6258]